MGTIKLKQKQNKKENPSKEEKLKIYADTVKVVPIDSIKQDPLNANKGDDGKLMKLIAKYGQRTPITVNMKTGIIHKGNTTWRAMKALGYDRIAITPQPFENDKEIAGYSISDNVSKEWSDMDDAMIAHIIKEKFKGVENKEIAALTGFKEKDILSFSYDAELPLELEDVDLDTGGLSEKVDYMVIQFENRKAMLEFKNKIDPDGKHPRVVPFATLQPFIMVNKSTIKQSVTPVISTKQKIKLKKR